MKNPLLLLFVFALMSFSANTEATHFQDSPSELLKGTYGSPLVNLTINDDQTFLYTDHSDKSNPINVSGTWKYSKGKLVLSSSTSVKYHNKWSVKSDSKSIKSRKGMAFYRLCFTE